MTKEKRTHITQNLRQVCGSTEGTKMYVITTVHSGETEVVVDHKISKRFPVQDLEQAEEMFEKLTHGRGRRVYGLEEIANEELTNPKNHD